MKIYLYSETGKNKKVCEDAILINNKVYRSEYCELTLESPAIIAVADGVGGNAGGDIASKFVLESLSQIDISDVTENKIIDILTSVNKRLIEYASTIDVKKKMATTLTGVIISHDVYIFHIGNTRLYGQQKSYLKQLTKDQTTYQWLIDCGMLDVAETCNKNEILHCFGNAIDCLTGHLFVKTIAKNVNFKRIILTTDGIHEYISLDDLEDILLADPDEQILRFIAKKASDNGSTDDKSIIIAELI